MKQLFLALLVLTSIAVQAQKNIFLDQEFWKGNPDVATIQAEIAKGNNPSESNAMAFDPVTYAINAQVENKAIKFLVEQTGNGVNKLTHDARTYIFLAASRGNLEIVEYLISKNAKVNIEDSHGATPLSYAASSGQANTKIYETLVKAGANLKQLNRDGANLLLLAIGNDKDLTLTNYFISKGLSLQSTDAAGNTAFNYVARTGNIALMKTLIGKGVKYNDNAMLMASQGTRGTSNTLEVYKYLEGLKIKPAAINKNGENVLHAIARKPNQEEVINYFLSKGVDINQADNDGNTPFMLAASSNRDTATLALLLTGVKNINLVNKKGVSALAMAVRSNSAETVQFLIHHGAKLDVADTDGNNLAYYLLQSYNAQGGGRQGGGPQGGGGRQGGGGQQANRQGENRPAGGEQRADPFGTKMKLLQQCGFNLATPQKDGNTLYHLAVVKNDLALLKRFEDLNIDVNSKNKEGLTPLHKAAMVSKDDVILKYLLSINAKKEITTEFKETAFDLSKENEYLSKNNVSTDFLK